MGRKGMWYSAWEIMLTSRMAYQERKLARIMIVFYCSMRYAPTIVHRGVGQGVENDGFQLR